MQPKRKPGGKQPARENIAEPKQHGGEHCRRVVCALYCQIEEDQQQQQHDRNAEFLSGQDTIGLPVTGKAVPTLCANDLRCDFGGTVKKNRRRGGFGVFFGTLDTLPPKTNCLPEKRILRQRPPELFLYCADSGITAKQKLHCDPPVIWRPLGKQLIQPRCDGKKSGFDRLVIAHRNGFAAILPRGGERRAQQGRERFLLPCARSDNAHAEQLR